MTAIWLLLGAILLLYPYRLSLYWGEALNLVHLLQLALILAFVWALAKNRLQLPPFYLWVFIGVASIQLLGVLGAAAKGFPVQMVPVVRDLTALALFTLTAVLLGSQRAHERLWKMLAWSVVLSAGLVLGLFLASQTFVPRDAAHALLLLTRAREMQKQLETYSIQVEDYAEYLTRWSVGNAEDYALHLAMFAPIFLYLAFYREREPSWPALRGGKALWWVALAMSFAGVLLAISRGAVLVLAGTSLFMFLMTGGISRRRIVTGALVAVPILALLFVDADFRQLFESRFAVGMDSKSEFLGEDRSARQRLAMQRAALEVFSREPLLGIGTDNIPLDNLKRFNVHNTAEQAYVQLLAEKGLFGTLPLLLVGGLLWGRFRRQQRAQPHPRFELYKTVLVAMALTAIVTPLHMDPLAFILLGAIFSRVNMHLGEEADTVSVPWERPQEFA